MRIRAMPASAKVKTFLSLAAAIVAASLMVLAAAMRPAEAAFPGNNGVIAFASDRITPHNPEGDLEIFLYLPGSGTVSQLTSNDEIDAEPTWSPAGQKIAFTSSRDSNPGFNFEVYKMDADGTDQIRLTNTPSSDEHPSWSPDGTKIVFESQRNGGNPEVYKMDADGTDQVRLTNSSAYDTQPAWSPNGKRLAFVSSRKANGYPEIYKMKPRPEGPNNRPVRLTRSEAYNYSPEWSPSGTKLAFWTNRDGDFEIYTMDADGTDQTNLTNNPAEDREPAWSPDGTQIAFVSNRVPDFENQTASFEVYTMSADGTAPQNLTNNAARDLHPYWQPF